MSKSVAIGDRFGAWTVVEPVTVIRGDRTRRWLLCRCDCGTERAIAGGALRAKQTTQCQACGNRQKAAMKARLVHGLSDTRTHRIWTQMRRRCEKPDCEDYPRYGGRGIKVCAEWADFETFHAWAMANGYRSNLTLDRRDNDGNYEPDNCRWVSRTVQNRNRRDNIRFQWRGKMLTLPEIAERTGVSHDLLRQRVRRDGLSVAEAISRPIRTSKHRQRSISA